MEKDNYKNVFELDKKVSDLLTESRINYLDNLKNTLSAFLFQARQGKFNTTFSNDFLNIETTFNDVYPPHKNDYDDNVQSKISHCRNLISNVKFTAKIST